MTKAALIKAYPAVKSAAAVADILSCVPAQYGIDGLSFKYFLANVLHESAGFSQMVESLNYSVDGLLKTFSRSRISAAQAAQYGRVPGRAANQKAIANILYGGAFGKRNLGNEQPNDGWDFRGGGPIQITGRANYTLFTAYYNKKYATKHSVAAMAEMIRTDINIGIHSACWFYGVLKNLNGVTDFLKVVRTINGGYNGLEDRKSILSRL